jgi:hypothetical protein
VSHDSGETWRRHKISSLDDIFFAQAFSAEKALIVGNKNFVAQVELQGSSKPPQIVPDATSGTMGDLRWLSPGGQAGQVAVGPGSIMRLVTFSKILAPLRSGDSEDFRRLAVNETVQKEAFASLPENSMPLYTLKDIFGTISRINNDLATNQQKVVNIDKRREDSINHSTMTSQEYMWWLNGSRALVVVIAFFLIRFLSSLYKYHRNLAAYFEARGDMLSMLRVIPGTALELSGIFTPNVVDEASPGNIVDEMLASAKTILGGQPKP